MAATSFPDDCLPPEAEYESRNVLFKVINAWVLSSRDPCPIAEILSNPRSIPYRSSNSVPTILQYSDTTLTKTLNSEYPPTPLTHFLLLSKLWTTLENPNHISVFICLHRSVLVFWTPNLFSCLRLSFHLSVFDILNRFSTLTLLF